MYATKEQREFISRHGEDALVRLNELCDKREALGCQTHLLGSEAAEYEDLLGKWGQAEADMNRGCPFTPPG